MRSTKLETTAIDGFECKWSNLKAPDTTSSYYFITFLCRKIHGICQFVLGTRSLPRLFASWHETESGHTKGILAQQDHVQNILSIFYALVPMFTLDIVEIMLRIFLLKFYKPSSCQFFSGLCMFISTRTFFVEALFLCFVLARWPRPCNNSSNSLQLFSTSKV